MIVTIMIMVSARWSLPQKTMQAEMDELRALQLQEKKVFLTNLEGMERALKEKGRETDEVRTLVSILALADCLYVVCPKVFLSGRVPSGARFEPGPRRFPRLFFFSFAIALFVFERSSVHRRYR